MALPAVVWKPSPNFWQGRSGHPILATVRHRIVGTLGSADTVFADPARQASTHFGIGHINGTLEIHQYVNLSDSAWGNGDVREPTAAVVLANPGVNPNLYTVSIEHEDGGAGNRGVVAPDTWQASIDLGVLLASGDIAAIRRAGIRIRDDATAAQLAAILPSADGHIDHHQIAGPNKPFCFRRWLDDPGFVEGKPSRRDELLAALGGAAVADPAEILKDCRARVARLRRQRNELAVQLTALEADVAATLKTNARLRGRINRIKEITAAMAADVADE